VAYWHQAACNDANEGIAYLLDVWHRGG